MELDWFNIVWEIFPFLFVSFLAVWIYTLVSKRVERRNREKRLKRGKLAENDAKKLLEKTGYSIQDYQPRLKYKFKSDGDLVSVEITPDFLVVRGGKTYVVEVKTGVVAANANYAATRRQMLEYSMVSNYPMLFVDMEQKSIREIEFPFTQKSTGFNWWKYFSLFLISAMGIALITMAISGLLKML